MTIGFIDYTAQHPDFTALGPTLANEANDYLANLTIGNMDLTLTGSGNGVVYGSTGSDTIDASGSTGNVTMFAGTGSDTLTGGSGNDTFFTSTGNDTVTGGSGNDNFFVNYIPGFENGTNQISITGGSGDNVAHFNDSATDATINNVAGVTTIDFTAGANAGQDITTSNVQSLVFLDQTVHG